MQQNSQRSGISSENDNLSGATVQRLGRLVGTLLELAVVAGGLDDVEDFLCDYMSVPGSSAVLYEKYSDSASLIPGSGQRRRRATQQTRSGWTSWLFDSVCRDCKNVFQGSFP